MAKIIYRQGDLLKGSELCILHGCNAQKRMGRGIALAIREQLPWAYNAYMSVEKLQLGSVVWAFQITGKDWHARSRIVGNLITQEYWQADKGINGRNVDYDALRSCIKEVGRFVTMTHNGTISVTSIGVIHNVGMPMIGAGLGGGNWDIISSIIEEESGEIFQPIVYKLP